MSMRLDSNYLNGIRDALEAIDRVGGTGVLAALSALGLTPADVGSPAFLRAAQDRADRLKTSEAEFLADKADDFQTRRLV